MPEFADHAKHIESHQGIHKGKRRPLSVMSEDIGLWDTSTLNSWLTAPVSVL